MRVNSLTELNLHDSGLIDFVISSDNAAEVLIHLDYIEDYETLHTSKKSLVFRGCIKIVVDANLLVTTDSLRDGHEITDSNLLKAVKDKLANSGFTTSMS